MGQNGIYQVFAPVKRVGKGCDIQRGISVQQIGVEGGGIGRVKLYSMGQDGGIGPAPSYAISTLNINLFV